MGWPDRRRRARRRRDQPRAPRRLLLQLAFFGFATGAVALALGAATGRRSLANGAAAGVALVGWLINGFAPLVGSIGWLKYLSLFYYYEGNDPLTQGVDVGDLVVSGS